MPCGYCAREPRNKQQPIAYANLDAKKKVSRRDLDILLVTAYSYKMTKREKLIAKALNNPKGLSFQDFQQLLRDANWTFDHQRGSHQIWYSPSGHRLSIQDGRDGDRKSVV